jgi:DNA-binding response OmpR family regulator
MILGNKLLVVEDDPSLQAAIQSVFGIHNDTEVVSDLSTARALLGRSHFDAILLDKGLPDGDGFSLIAPIREHYPFAAILVMTGSRDFNAASKCIAAGADDYIVKSETLISDLLVRLPIVLQHATLRKKAASAPSIPDLRLPQSELELSAERHRSFLAAAEKAFLTRAIELCGDDAAFAAEKIGLAKSTIFKKILDLSIERRGNRRPRSGSFTHDS